MPGSCRFAMAVHVLAVLAYQLESGATSALIASSVNTNPVVIRRLLCALREAGLVETQKGAGLGSRLMRPSHAITLADIYRAVETGEGFSFPGSVPNAKCPVGANMQSALETIFTSAQDAMERELETKTLADILRKVARAKTKRAKEPHKL